jgi:hypothetical protein
MFRLAPIVLLAASLSSLAFAQVADLAAKNPKQDVAANGSVPSANGSDQNAPAAVNADAAAAGAKPKPLPFLGSAYLELSIDNKMLNAFVHGAEPGYMGVVGLSPTPDLAHSFTGLPPLLVDAVVVAYGFTKTQDLELSAPLSSMPMDGTLVYGQAIVLDGQGIWASGIVPLMIGQAVGNQKASAPAIN